MEPADPAAAPDVRGLGVRLAKDGSLSLVEPVQGAGWWRLAGPGQVVANLRIGGWAMEAVLEVDGDHGRGRARAIPIAAASGAIRTLDLWARKGRRS